MSTTKHLILTERPGTHIEIVSVDGRPAIIVTDDHSSRMAHFEPADGAKTALAILEAAGFEDSSSGGCITGARIAVGDLRRHVAKLERASAEAKEQAELEAEAFKLRRAYLEGRAGFDSWNELTDAERDHWLAVARKAREMRKP